MSWLPSFSVEVSHAHLLRSSEHVTAPNSQLDAMGRQVQQLFPHIPFSLIIDDLRVTRSVEMTIENVLESRLTVPPTLYNRNEQIERDNSLRHRHVVSPTAQLVLPSRSPIDTSPSTSDLHYDDFNERLGLVLTSTKFP